MAKWIGQWVIALLLIERVIGIAVGVEGVESLAVVLVKRQPEFDALRQVRIREEMAPERHRISISLFYNLLGRVGFESTRGDDAPFEYPAEPLRSNRSLT